MSKEVRRSYDAEFREGAVQMTPEVTMVDLALIRLWTESPHQIKTRRSVARGCAIAQRKALRRRRHADRRQATLG